MGSGAQVATGNEKPGEYSVYSPGLIPFPRLLGLNSQIFRQRFVQRLGKASKASKGDRNQSNDDDEGQGDDCHFSSP